MLLIFYVVVVVVVFDNAEGDVAVFLKFVVNWDDPGLWFFVLQLSRKSNDMVFFIGIRCIECLRYPAMYF
jgi:hypothetical protein